MLAIDFTIDFGLMLLDNAQSSLSIFSFSSVSNFSFRVLDANNGHERVPQTSRIPSVAENTSLSHGIAVVASAVVVVAFAETLLPFVRSLEVLCCLTWQRGHVD
ncbi:uncharacterized protein LOC107772241 isoform X1 [Nicotiana tabacum]|uniref:Uncharacterized protein LOC107772241 isoform X1 n=1 Tax=Nicotiana tabacum TaxID=4097 RepID=A0A1S3Y4Y2_TOBAC|nr:PREDICTED: uncharacterized protein LOC107772241 isoform X2 [Nicotiana tabacum]